MPSKACRPSTSTSSPPGTGISGATPWGTVAFEGTLPARNIAPGDYDMIATEHGNPAHVLYTSPSSLSPRAPH